MAIWLNPAFILTTGLIAFVTQVLRNYWFDVPLLTDGTSTETETAVARNLNLLQSHPRCGLTSGGREECWWGCDRKNTLYGFMFKVKFMIDYKKKLYRIKLEDHVLGLVHSYIVNF